MTSSPYGSVAIMKSGVKVSKQPRADAPISDDTYSEAETVARREAALKRMLETPHKPHEPIKRKAKESQPK